MDKTAPTISLWSGSLAISPNGDGSQDSAWVRATLTDLSLPIAWKVEVRNKATGALVRSSPTQSLASSGAVVSYEWNGQDDAGAPVDDGTYTYAFVATDAQALSRTSVTADLAVDRVFPTLLSYTATPEKVSPNADGIDDLVTFAASAGESVTHTISIVRQATGALVKTITASGTTLNTTWNGRDTAGNLVPEGTYTARLTISDAAGNKVTASVSQWIDGWAPVITGPTISEAWFSPNSDGRKDTTVVGATLSDGWAPISWTIEVKNAAGAVVRSFSGAGSATATQVVVSQSWDGKDNAGVLAPDATYTVSVSATDGGATRGTKTGTVVLDTAPPDLDPRTISPAEFTNTVYSSQPLVAKISDSLAGLDLASLTFVLRDETTGTATTTAGASVSYNATTRWAKTPPRSLTAGHTYRVEFSALDRAGNLVSYAQQPASEGGGFLATTIALNPTWARIPPSQCVLSDRDIANDIQKATCTGVPLSFDATTVVWGGTKHADVGYVEQQASLASAQIKHGVAASGTSLVSLYAYQEWDPAWGPRTVSMRYEAPEVTTATTTYSVPAVTRDIGTLVTWVPASWTAAYLEMDGPFAAGTTPSHAGCADPSASTTAVLCTPDSLANRYIVVLKDTVADPAAVASQHAQIYAAETRFVYTSALKGYAAFLPPQGLQSVISDTQVSFVERGRTFRIDDPPATLTDPPGIEVAPTGVKRIKAEGMQNVASGIDVAVIDTGIDLDHPDLAPNISSKSKNCVPSGSNPDETADDDEGHGSHVAGSIAAARNGTGVVGVAPGATLWAVKVLAGGLIDGGTGEWEWVICGLDYVDTKAPVNGGPIDVANMSLGGSGDDDGNCGRDNSDAVHRAICKVVNDGVTVVVAAGNSRESVKLHIPAAYDEVISVSALADSDGAPCHVGPPTSDADVGGEGFDDTFAYFSNFAVAANAAHVVGAPGVDILSTYQLGAYALASGTSMASPHAAGAAALYIKGNPAAAPADVLDALKRLGEPVGINFNGECLLGRSSHTDQSPGGRHGEPVVRVDLL